MDYTPLIEKRRQRLEELEAAIALNRTSSMTRKRPRKS